MSTFYHNKLDANGTKTVVFWSNMIYLIYMAYLFLNSYSTKSENRLKGITQADLYYQRPLTRMIFEYIKWKMKKKDMIYIFHFVMFVLHWLWDCKFHLFWYRFNTQNPLSFFYFSQVWRHNKKNVFNFLIWTNAWFIHLYISIRIKCESKNTLKWQKGRYTTLCLLKVIK